jgi:hypothetical protein
MSMANSKAKLPEFQVVVRIKIHDPKRVMDAARVVMGGAGLDFDQWVAEQDEVGGLAAAMYWLIEPCVDSEANGFEIVDQNSFCVGDGNDGH